FMSAGDVAPDGHVSYRRQLTVPGDVVVSAALAAGAATGLSILIDDVLVARQEKVEYYESSWGATPMFFSHDVTAQLSPGEHHIELVADSTDRRDVALLDLVVQTDAGVTTLVSGPGWATAGGGVRSTSRENRGHWTELAHVHTAERTHPLPDVSWLHGEPVVGVAAHPFRTSDSLAPAVQWYRGRLPAGTTHFTLPMPGPGVVEVNGQPCAVTDGYVRLAAPLAQPGELTVTTEPTVFDRGGAAWTGPLVVSTVEAPVELGDWQQIGLRSWSGAVRYRRALHVPVDSARATLDLGRVRGSLDVFVDGRRTATAFCAPYRVDLGDARGDVVVDVTVHNTLAPFLDESTPTMWLFPSQLESGLIGPVTLETYTSQTFAPNQEETP
ncbi:MAG: hypothetical protein ACRYG2_38470, partial [Janthinobacterium lividum]